MKNFRNLLRAASVPGFLVVLVLLLLSGSLLAQTMVTLNPSASPTAGDPGITNINVTGHGFPSGTIPPANVTVTLNPTNPGPPSGSTTALSVTVVSGSTERVMFRIPKTISVSTATSYQVSISGTTSTGHAFQSSNTAALTVNPILTILTQSPLPAGTVSVNYSKTLTAKGGSGGYAWSISAGALPGGLSLSASGVISGLPTTAGPANFTVKVTDSIGGTATKAFSMTINSALVITTNSPLPAGTVNANYSTSLTATGGNGSYTWAVSVGTLPAGLSLNTATGVISGLPTTAGTSNFTIKVTDSNHVTASKPFALTINPALVITTTSPLPTGTVNANYSTTLLATGGSGSYTWSVSVGTLPGGLSLNASTGVISGQPTTAGTPSFTIQVTDSNQASTTKPFSMTINPALVITTTSPLPTGTVNVSYSQALAATGGSGQYTWAVSVGSLPGGLSLNTATGLISGQPTTAGNPSFTIQVTDSNQVSTSKQFSVTINAALVITTTSPLPTGQVGVNYSQTLAATGGSGQYTWAVTVGTLPGGLSLTPATGLIGGQPTTATTANFTIQVTDTNQVTASMPFVLTINPAASLMSVSPNSGNAGISLQVSITGSFTHFVQGSTQASFGAGIAVGGGTVGQAGPVTVNSPTSATAQLSISAAAATGSQNVTVTTGSEQVTLTNGFSVAAAIPFITVDTTTATTIPTNFSGFADEYLLTGVEYNDPKFLPFVQAMKPGFIRFPSGEPSMAFDWQSAHMNQAWITQLAPSLSSNALAGLNLAKSMTQAKGGACFVPGTCFSDFSTFIHTLGANGIVDFNGWTDTNTNSAGLMVSAAQTAGATIAEWELANEPYVYPLIFPTPASYAAAEQNPYYNNIFATNPNTTVGDFYQGAFSFVGGNYQAWDNGMSAYSPRYWNSVLTHIYPVTQFNISTANEEKLLNGVLAHGTTEYISSYLAPVVGANTPIYITEMNSDAFATLAFESYLYNGIFLAEYIARMSTSPNVKAVAVQPLFLPNTFNQGIIRAVNDFQSYLLTQVSHNPNYSTNTATNPNTQFQFYFSANALCLEVLNLAVNNSNAIWPTTVNGGPTVPISGYDGQPIPAVFSQAYQGIDGTHYLIITNKSASTLQVALEVNGTLLEQSVTVSSVSNASDTAQNTATNQTTLQIVTTTSPNPITIGPYSVTRVEW